jgi:hypothetical protein
MTNNKFNFFVDADIPDDIYKASKDAKSEDRYKNMLIYGLASDSSEDSEGEFMEPSGFEIDDFLSKGLINLEHFTSRKGDPQFWIGEPVEGKVKNNEFFVKAKLWEKHPLARNFWDTLLIMKASGSTRKAGFSIEGKALARDPMNKKRVTKARISHLAATLSPINKNSWADIVKGEQKEDFIEPEIDSSENPKYIYEFEKAGKCYGVKKNFEIEEKEDEEDEEEKAITTSNTELLRKESIDKKTKNIVRKALRTGKISPKNAYKFIKSFYNS